MQVVKSVITGRYVPIRGGQEQLWTLSINEASKSRYPLVLVHGFGGGSGIWAQNFETLSNKRSVYAFDLLGESVFLGRDFRIRLLGCSPGVGTFAELCQVSSGLRNAAKVSAPFSHKQSPCILLAFL